ncbi:hypothetical protein K2X05_02250 [bacterium]|nr:hypothetical protein [bacterium]
MLQIDRSFQSIEIALANKIVGILMHTLRRKHNSELNLFYLPNPLLAFSIMNSKAFHFCRIRSLQHHETSQDQLRLVLDYWLSQGAESEFFEEIKKFSATDINSANIVYFKSPAETEEVIAYFQAKTQFVLFKKREVSKPNETIWEFMHPFWKFSEILDHAELQIGSDLYFILTCEKR